MTSLRKEEGSRHDKWSLCPKSHVRSVAGDSQPRSGPPVLLSTFLPPWWWPLCICSFHTKTSPSYKAHAQLKRLWKLLKLTRFPRLFPEDKEENFWRDWVDWQAVQGASSREVTSSVLIYSEVGFSEGSLPFSQSWTSKKLLTNAPLSKINLAVTKLHLNAISTIIFFSFFFFALLLVPTRVERICHISPRGGVYLKTVLATWRSS